MTLNWADVGWVAFVLVGCSVALSLATTVGLHALLLRGLAAAVRAGSMAPDEAHTDYLKRFALFTRAAFFLLVGLLLVLIDPQLFSSTLSPWLPPLTVGPTVGVVALAVTAWFAVQAIASAACRVTPDYMTLRATPFEPIPAFVRIVRFVLIRYGAALALVEAAAAFVIFGWPDLLWLIPVAAALGVLAYRFLSPYELRWHIPSRPIERTDWAALAPRIAGWASRAGVRIGSIQVLANRDTGTAGAGFMGVGKPTLCLGDNVLAATEWRQQDAVVAVLLGLARRSGDIAIAKIIWAVMETSVLAALVRTLAFFNTSDPAAVASLAPIAVVSLTAAATLYLIGRFSVGNPLPRFARRADCYAAELIGDPLAVLVALHTMGELRGQSGAMSARIQRLDALRQRPGPWAPWADLPVPSAVPFVLDGRTLTTPLDSAQPPAPVPAEPYPARGPVAIAVDEPVDVQIPPLPAGRGGRG
jgi:hypothetical protein